MRPLVYFGVSAILVVAASLGRFRSVELFPWIFGPVWAVACVVLLLWRRRRMSRTQIALTATAGVLAILAPVGQIASFRVTQARQQREALAALEHGAPPLVFAHVLNNHGQPWPNDADPPPLTLVNFWASWCAPCLSEMPMLEQFSRSHDRSLVRVVGFTRFYDATDEAGRAEELRRIDDLVRRKGLTYPTLVALGAATHEQFRVDGLPTSVLIDAHGKVLAYGVGKAGTKRLLDMADRLTTKKQG